MRTARTPSVWGFDRYDGLRLRRAMAAAVDVRLFRRLQAVRLVCEGYGLGEAARLTGASRRAVYEWVGLYLASRRPGGLADAPRSGRPRAAGAVTDARIVREYGGDPLRLGYVATEWTVPLLARHLSRRYGCEVTPHTLRRRVRALGLRWKRPRHVFGDRDPHGAWEKGRSTAG